MRIPKKEILLLFMSMIFWGGYLFFQFVNEKELNFFWDQNLKVFQLDVGQADATLIIAPDRTVTLIDAGSIQRSHARVINSGEKVIGPFLRRLNIHHIEHLILTHHDSDHMGGAPWLLKNFSVGFVYDNGRKEITDIYRKFSNTVKTLKIPYQTLERGDKLQLGSGVIAHILSPNYENEFDDNDQSIVMKIVYGNFELLTTGDIEKATERELCVFYGKQLKADLLKSPHHGSKTSSSKPLLAYIQPSVVSVSVGADNSYGHPSSSVIDRYREFESCRILRTDQDGSIFFISNGIECYAAGEKTAETYSIKI